MNARKNPLDSLLVVPAFTTKEPRQQPIPTDAIERIAENRNFPSREAPKTTKRSREQRRFRTGRNQHIGVKATDETRERFYKMADDRNVPLGELLRIALDALEGRGTVGH